MTTLIAPDYLRGKFKSLTPRSRKDARSIWAARARLAGYSRSEIQWALDVSKQTALFEIRRGLRLLDQKTPVVMPQPKVKVGENISLAAAPWDKPVEPPVPLKLVHSS